MAGGGDRILLGEVVAAHGVRGLVRIRTYTEDPQAIADYGPLHDGNGREVRLEVRGPARGGVLAAVEGVGDRNQAEALRGTGLYVERAKLPPAEEDEYYLVDLIGLEVRGEKGERLGEVVAVPDFGAGSLLEIRLDGRRDTVLVPFVAEYVPQVEIPAGFVVIRPAEGLID